MHATGQEFDPPRLHQHTSPKQSTDFSSAVIARCRCSLKIQESNDSPQVEMQGAVRVAQATGKAPPNRASGSLVSGDTKIVVTIERIGCLVRLGIRLYGQVTKRIW